MLLGEDGFAGEAGGRAEFFLDAKELVVLGDAVGARGGTRLDLTGGGRDGEVGDEGVFGLAAAVGDDRVEAGFAAKLYRVDCFGHGADLIQFDQDRIGDAFVDAAR